MNFIRDIIGEKRQLHGQAAPRPDARAEDRPVTDWSDPLPEFSPQNPAEQAEVEPKVMDEDDPILASETETFEAEPTDAEKHEDTVTRSDEAGLPPSEDAVLTAPQRDVYAELRSIFVAEQKDRVQDEAAFHPEAAARNAAAMAAEHEPLKAAIARAEREYSSHGLDDVEPEDEVAPSEDTLDGGWDTDWDDPDDAGAEDVETAADLTPEPPPRAAEPEAADEVVAVPGPAMGRGSSHKGRVKTRLLGFNIEREEDVDPISGGQAARPAAYTKFPLGWLIVTDGPGRGAAFTLFNGVSQIGRGKNQTISLDFGDNSISRENHAAIAYDPAQNRFYIGHGGKANLVRRNERPVLATEELNSGDRITIGETSLRFVPLCGEEFSWQAAEEGHWSDAANG